MAIPSSSPESGFGLRASTPRRPEEIVLDLDATDDPLHVPPPDRRFDLPPDFLSPATIKLTVPPRQ